MKDISPQEESTTSVVRLTFHFAYKDKIEASEEWYAATDKLKQEPNIGFVTKGQSIDDELNIVLFISWDYAAKPSASFLSGNIDHIFSSISEFLAKRPRLICNVCHVDRGQCVNTFRTSRSGFETMREIMIVRGPVNTIEPIIKKINKDARGYIHALDIGMDCYDIHISDQTFWGIGLYRVSNENGNEELCSQGHTDCASFAIFFQWFSPSRRAEFLDPNIPDRAIPPVFQEFYGSNWWQQKVMKPLEDVGATISSWTYHKGEIARDRKGILVISKFKNWLDFGYMDDVSLAQFERQLAEKEPL